MINFSNSYSVSEIIFPFFGTLIASPALYNAVTNNAARYGQILESINISFVMGTLHSMPFVTLRDIGLAVTLYYSNGSYVVVFSSINTT